ncbi:MAG: tyrosine-type recombinase/integrase [Fibrobacteres bacterium]|nr:tyrosine-type recombinase/integrase [Fibrobacterota bacterium]
MKVNPGRPRGPRAWQIPSRTVLQQWCARWIEWLRVNGFSGNTVLNRQAALRRLIEYADIAGLTEPSEFDSAHAMSFRRWLMGHSQAESAFCQYLVGARLFCRWCVRQGLMTTEPVEELRIRGFRKPLPQGILRVDEVEQVLAVPDVQTSLGLRDRAILEVFYSTGIRRAELSHLRTVDVHWERGLIFIRQGKGGRDRYVPIGQRALAWVRAYLDRVRVHLAPVDDQSWLWLGVRGEVYSDITVGKMVKACFQKAGIDRKGVSCHMMRHTCATLLMENGADLRAVQEILGHRSLESTQVYTHVSQVRAKEVHTRCHPAERQILVEAKGLH